MGMRFEDMPKNREFKAERLVRFKPEDGIKNMAFSQKLEIKMEITDIRSEEARNKLEELMDRTMAEAKRIIAEHEAPQRNHENNEDEALNLWLQYGKEHQRAADDTASES